MLATDSEKACFYKISSKEVSYGVSHGTSEDESGSNESASGVGSDGRVCGRDRHCGL